MAIELGSGVVDRITGFKGVATSRTIYLSGCARIGVQPLVDKDGKLPESQFFDEIQLDVIAPAAKKNGPVGSVTAG